MIRASFFGSSGEAAMLNRECSEAGAATGQTTAQSNCTGRRPDSSTKEKGDRASASGEETD